MGEETKPPALPEGATWQGQDSDGDWCAVSEDGRRVWIMGDGLTDGWQEFHDAEMFAHVRLVWVEHLVKVAAAERALRKAEANVAVRRYEISTALYDAAASRLAECRKALRALGVEP